MAFTSHKITKQNKSSNNTQKRDIECEFCKKKGHKIYRYFGFKDLKLQDRWNWVKENKICYKCLRKGHTSVKCKRFNCQIAGCKKIIIDCYIK